MVNVKKSSFQVKVPVFYSVYVYCEYMPCFIVPMYYLTDIINKLSAYRLGSSNLSIAIKNNKVSAYIMT